MWVQLILTLIVMCLVLSDTISRTNDNFYKVATLAFIIFTIEAWKKLTTRPDGRFILDIPQKHHI